MLKLPDMFADGSGGVIGILYLVEVVLVELADEASKVGMAKVARKDVFCKVVHVLDDEALARGGPCDD